MAIAFIFEIEAMTQEQYDELMGAMGLAEGGVTAAERTTSGSASV